MIIFYRYRSPRKSDFTAFLITLGKLSGKTLAILCLLSLIVPSKVVYEDTAPQDVDKSFKVVLCLNLSDIEYVKTDVEALVRDSAEETLQSIRSKYKYTELVKLGAANFIVVKSEATHPLLLRRIKLPSLLGSPKLVLELLASRHVPIVSEVDQLIGDPKSKIDNFSEVKFTAFEGKVIDGILRSIPSTYPRLAADINVSNGVIEVTYFGPSPDTPQLSAEANNRLAAFYRPIVGDLDLSVATQSSYPRFSQDSDGIDALDSFARAWKIKVLVETSASTALSYAQKIALRKSLPQDTDGIDEAVVELSLILEGYAVRRDLNQDNLAWVLGPSRNQNILQQSIALSEFSGTLEGLPAMLQNHNIHVDWAPPLDFDPFNKDRTSIKLQWPKYDGILGDYLANNLSKLLGACGVICAFTDSTLANSTVNTVQRVNGELIFDEKSVNAIMTVGLSK